MNITEDERGKMKQFIDLLLFILGGFGAMLILIIKTVYKIDKKTTILTTELPIIKQDVKEADNKAEKAHRRLDNVDKIMDNHELRINNLERLNND